MDEHSRPDTPPAGQAQGETSASTHAAATKPETTKKVTVKDIYGELLTPTNLTLVGAALLLGLVGLLGGWDKVSGKETELTSVAPNKEITASPFTMTFRKAFRYKDVQGLPFIRDGQRGLVVTVDVVNTSKEPLDMMDFRLHKIFRLKDVGGLTYYSQPVEAEKAQPVLYRFTDSLNAKHVQPGLTTRLVLLWEQKDTEPIPKTLTVVAYQHEFKESVLTGTMEYLNPTPAAQITLPVKEVKP